MLAGLPAPTIVPPEHIMNIRNTLALLAAVAFAPSALAATADATFQVSINITSTCSVAAQDLDFGSHPSTATNVNADGELEITCTPGTDYTVALDAGANGGGDVNSRRMTNGTGFVPYQLYSDPGRTTVWGDVSGTVSGTGNGAAQTLPVYGRVPDANFPAGAYADLVTVTVTY